MYKVIHVDRSKGKILEEKLGGYNDFPPNWIEITQSDFLRRTLMCVPQYIDYRQMYSTKKDGRTKNFHQTYTPATLYIYQDLSGVAVERVYQHNGTYTAKYYAFIACVHDFETVTQRMCYSKSKCKKCGYVMEIDSSD